MNREQMIKDRDAYLDKIKSEVESRYSNAFNFYQQPENFTPSPTPADWKQGKNSRKGLESTKSLLTEPQLLHLLRRTKMGVSKHDFDIFSGLDVAEIVDMLLTEEELAPPVNDYEPDVADPDVPFGETFINAPYNGDVEGERTVTIKSWFINEMRKESTSMHSTMWLFWHNHLPIEMWGIFNGKMVYNYTKLLHDYSFGDFKELMYNITIDPAVLIYLNGFVNVKDAPDENYGREVQELFCIGKGPNANYTESDVQAAARVLTGWSLDWNGGGDAIFYEWDHATEDKQFSEFYGNTVIEGKSGAAGAEELDEFFDMIFSNDEVAAFICRKLYTFFAYSTIDDWTEANIIQPLAQIFRDSNYTIRPVLEALLTSDHFYDEVNYGAIIKAPTDIVLGWWKAADLQFPFDAEEDIYNKKLVNRSLYWTMSDWGMDIGDPPNVAGWSAFYQYPTFDKTWITTSTIVRRIGFIDGFVYGQGLWSPNYWVGIDIIEFAREIEDVADPNLLIAHLEKFYLGLPISEEVKTNIKGTLLSGLEEDFYWTNAWNTFLADEENEANRQIVEYRLILMMYRFFQLAEFQLK